jgi:glycosyltransferase involved in cell wall biosynthesis
MRIAVFHNSPGEGGARRALASLLRELHRQHSIDLYSCVPISEEMVQIRDAVDRVNTASVTLLPCVAYRSRLLMRICNLFGTFCNLARMRRAAKRVARQIDRGGYDVLLTDICHVTMATDVLRYSQTPSVFLCQNPMRRTREPPALSLGICPPINSWIDACYEWSCCHVEAVEKWLLRQREQRNACAATRIVCNSCYSREAIYHAYGLMARPIELGVDRERFRCLGLSRERRILSVGGLQYNKGFHLIIDALAQCPAESRLPLTLVANRVDLSVVQRLYGRAAQGGVDLEIRSDISDEELVELHNRVLMTVFVPLMEPFGLVTIEAMACGTPVIAANQGGPREVIRDGETGLLVDRSPSAIAAAIQRLQDDATLWQSISTAALAEVAARWKWQHAAQQLEASLTEAAETAIDKEVKSANQRQG